MVTTAVNHFEVVLGIERESRGRRQEAIRSLWERFSASIPLLLLDHAGAELAGRRQAALVRAGEPASPSDILIAAIAAAHGCDVIVTADQRAFARIGLVKVVNS